MVKIATKTRVKSWDQICLIAKLSIDVRFWATRMKRYGDIGSPYRRPRLVVDPICRFFIDQNIKQHITNSHFDPINLATRELHFGKCSKN